MIFVLLLLSKSYTALRFQRAVKILYVSYQTGVSHMSPDCLLNRINQISQPYLYGRSVQHYCCNVDMEKAFLNFSALMSNLTEQNQCRLF